MTKKIFSIVVAIVIMSSVFYGCGTNGVQNAATATKASSQTQAASTADTTAAKEPVKITWFDLGAYNTEQMDNVLGELKEKENIEVEAQHVANDSITILKTKINAGEIPDVFINTAGPYNDVFAEYSTDLSSEPLLDKFLPWTLEACKSNGKIIGFPMNIETFAFIYNKKLFAEAGITELPKTLKELEELCVTLKAKGITAFSNGYKDTFVLFMHQASHFFMANGGTPKDVAAKISSGELAFDKNKYFENYLDLVDLTVKYGLPKPLETGWEQEEINLATGKAAIMHMGSWCEPVLTKANADVDVAFMPIPISNDPSEAKISSDVSWLAKVNSKTKYKDAAVKAIEYFLTSGNGMKYTVADSGWVLALKDVPLKPKGMLANSVSDILSKSSAYPWASTAWTDGFYKKAGAVVQAYIAGAKDRAAVKLEINTIWKDLAAPQ